jgi:response regulator of citrate/malate metabolism
MILETWDLARIQKPPIIGTVRLLLTGENVTIVFDDKDALFQQTITLEQRILFKAFWQRTRNHFEEINLQIKMDSNENVEKEPEDSTDARIWKLLQGKGITLSDTEIGQKIDISRQNVNNRRNNLRKSGF